MNLGQALTVAGLNRNSYNTMTRRAGLDFMRFDYSGPAADRYELWHAVCLALVTELQDGGLALEHAASAITQCHAQLRDIIAQATPYEVQATWLSVEFPLRMTSPRDKIITLGTSPATSDPATIRYVVAVNLGPRICQTIAFHTRLENPSRHEEMHAAWQRAGRGFGE